MSKMAELAYDIEQLFIEGYNAKNIAKELGCPQSIVENWMKEHFLTEIAEATYNPYETINS